MAIANNYAGETSGPTPSEPTAAQSAANQAERVLMKISELRQRIEEMSGRLGHTSLAKDGVKAAGTVRPVRSGIIGTISDTLDSVENALTDISGLMNRIETQV
jgi:hypothetical protein